MSLPEANSHATPPFSPNSAREILRSNGLRPRKKLGQNFLVDPNVSRKLIRLLAPRSGEVFLEIGAGIGALTLPLAESGTRLFAVEIDRRLAPLLKAVVGRFESVHVMETSVLEVDIPALLARAGVRRIQVLGNLPYSTTTQILLYLLENRKHIGRALITVQKEYADRLLANAGTRLYGSISALAQFHSTIEKVMTIRPTCFFPEPGVTSVVLKIVFRDRPAVSVKDDILFTSLVRAAFAHRRKMLMNSILEWVPIGKPELAALLGVAGVEGSKRAEQLTLEEFGRIADVLYDRGLVLPSERKPSEHGARR